MLKRGLILLGAALFTLPAASAAPPADPDPTKANVDVVLCLDVSGSMQGLIDSAKVKLWDIVNDLGKAKPAPNLRVALYSYGHTTYDANKGWVRKESDFTTDLDAVYQKLNALTISGGTELVARVCRDAVADQKWSTDKRALKLIYVAGNEPADQDRQVSLPDVAKMAVEKDIIINTIYCDRGRGAILSAEAKGWDEFAKLAEGRFVAIDMNKGTVAIAAPQDKKLTELSGKLNTTYVPYGDRQERERKAQNQAAQDSNAAKSSPGAAAGRAVAKGGALYRNSDWDLVDRLKEDPKFDITKVPEDQLPEELKKLKPEERVKHVQEQLNKRLEIQKEIAELSKARDAYLREENKKNATAGEKAFDEAVRSTIREQAAKKGIKIPE